MKTRDTKRTNHQTFETNHPTVSFHLDSKSQERIPCGHKVSSFYKIKIDSVLKGRLMGDGNGREAIYSAKENNPRQEQEKVGQSQRGKYGIKSYCEGYDLSGRNSVNVSSYRPPKMKSQRTKNESVDASVKTNPTKPKSKKSKSNSLKDKQTTNDSLMKTGRQLIMSTMDSKMLRNLKVEKSYDKLRSITEEESEVLKAKRISFKKAVGKKEKVRTKMNETGLKIVVNSFDKQDQSFSLFKESVNEPFESEGQIDESIQSLSLDSEEQDLLSLQEMRKFESTGENKNPNARKYSSIQEVSALKIQNHWRSYKTRQTIKKYLRQGIGRSLVTEEFQPNKEMDFSFLGRKGGIVLERIDMNVVSPQSEEDSPDEKRKRVEQMRIEEGRKWAQIPELVEAYLSKNNSQADTRSLLERIATISERNKQDLLKQSKIYVNSSKLHHSSSKSIKSFASSSNSSIDELDHYNFQKYNKILNADNTSNLIKCRKTLLKQRYKAEKHILEQQWKNLEIDDEKYKRRKQQFEEWMEEETDEIETTKRYLDIGHQRAKQSLAKIKMDYIKMAKIKGITSKNTFSSSDSLLRYTRKDNRPIMIKHVKQIQSSQSIESEQQEQNTLENWQSNKQTLEMRRRLENLESQCSEGSLLLSNNSSQKILKRESNIPLHRQNSHVYSDSDSSEDSIDAEELASISFNIQMKNWMDKFRNKSEVKERIVDEIIGYEVEQMLKDLNSKGLERLLGAGEGEEGMEMEKGIQTDVETVKYFMEVMRQYFITNEEIEEYVLNIRFIKGKQEKFYQSIFKAVWEKILSELEFQQQHNIENKDLENIAQLHYRSMFDSLNQNILEQLNQQIKSKIPVGFQRNPISSKQALNIFNFSSSKLIVNSNFRCGLHKRNLVISDEDLQYVRSQRMDQMTTIQLNSSKHWLLSSDPSSTIQDIATSILNHLIHQLNQIPH